jgi:uncharacterized protein (TIGR03067 family)
LKREQQDLKEAQVQAGRAELTGSWQAVSYALDGNKASDKEMRKIKLTIDADGKSAALREAEVFIASNTKIDPTQTPMTIDITFTGGETNGKTAPGIYKIDDDILTICRTGPDKPRPVEFSSKPGSGHTLMTYKREPPAAK